MRRYIVIGTWGRRRLRIDRALCQICGTVVHEDREAIKKISQEIFDTENVKV